MGEAVRAAEAGVEGHREDAMRSLATTLGELESVCAGRDEGAETRVYELASAFTDMAGFFDTGPLYAAAFSLWPPRHERKHPMKRAPASARSPIASSSLWRTNSFS